MVPDAIKWHSLRTIRKKNVKFKIIKIKDKLSVCRLLLLR